MIEVMIVAFVTAIVMAIIMRLLSGAFSGAAKGYDNLAVLQEKSRLMAVLKQDLRTLIFAGVDNIPLPNVTYDADSRTNLFEFCKVRGIDENGRPLIEKITYRQDPLAPPSGSAFGVERQCEVGPTLQRKYLKDMLVNFKIELLDAQGLPISDASNFASLKKVLLQMESKGSVGNLWCPNYMFAEYAPGAPIRLFQGGVIQMSGNTALGMPLSLSGANIMGP
jgi:hypothetical protein